MYETRRFTIWDLRITKIIAGKCGLEWGRYESQFALVLILILNSLNFYLTVYIRESSNSGVSILSVNLSSSTGTCFCRDSLCDFNLSST